jgi:NitT/TauT family transport system substrate-binding protein
MRADGIALGSTRGDAARCNRRQFLEKTGKLIISSAGIALLAGCQSAPPRVAALRAGVESPQLRVVQTPSMCQSPLYVAQGLLRSEGFTELQYVKKPGPKWNGLAIASGEADITMHFAGPVIVQIEAGDPVVVLAGAHVGCFELFGNDGVQSIRDLKGKVVAIPELGAPGHVFLASMLAQVGLDPRTDVIWASHEPAEAIQLLAVGQVDAYLGFPPDPQEMHARNIGHVVVNSMDDRPWSQYFCCMVVANRDFVTRHPVATTRALRAILNGIDQSGHDPRGAVRFLVDQGYTTEYDYTLEAVSTIHAGGWRADYDAEDTLRYYALRLYEAGMIRSSPDDIIARGTDWRYLAEVRRDRAATAGAAYWCPIRSDVASQSTSQV